MTTNRPTPIGASSWTWTAIIAGAIAYGSLIPFQLKTDGADWPTWREFAALGVIKPSVEDVITNLLLYVPLGIAAASIGGAQAGRRLVRAVMIGGCLSIVIEALQTCVRMRVPSLTDVILNGLGTAVGAGVSLAWRRFLPAFRDLLVDSVNTRPSGCLLTVGTITMLVVGVIPFDFVTDTAQLHVAFRRSIITWTSCRPFLADPDRWLKDGGLLGDAAACVVLGYLAVLMTQERRMRGVLAWVSAVGHVSVAMILRELLQLFTNSHAFGVPPIIVGVVCAGVGAWVPAFWSQPAHTADLRSNPRRILPNLLLLVLLLATCAPAFACLASPIEQLGGLGRSLSTFRVPFESLWHQPMASAAATISEVFLRCALAGTCLAVILRRAGWSAAWWCSGALIVMAATITGNPRPNAAIDLTSGVLAIAAVLISRAFYSNVRPWLLAPMPQLQPGRATFHLSPRK